MPALLAYCTGASPVLEEVSPPELGPADVRIQVAAAAVNPVDVTVLTGPLRAVVGLPDPVGLGWDVSGTSPRSAARSSTWARATGWPASSTCSA